MPYAAFPGRNLQALHAGTKKYALVITCYVNKTMENTPHWAAIHITFPIKYNTGSYHSPARNSDYI
jgi:hypothetical protein